MSKASKVIRRVADPLGLIPEKLGGSKGMDRAGKGDAGGPAPGPKPVERASDALEQENMLKARAIGAGAIKTENQEDVLGYGAAPKRKSATRTLLG